MIHTPVTRVGFGMGFFRDPEYRSREFGIGIFYFGLDRKISKSRGSGFENPEKTRKKNPEIKVLIAL